MSKKERRVTNILCGKYNKAAIFIYFLIFLYLVTSESTGMRNG